MLNLVRSVQGILNKVRFGNRKLDQVVLGYI